MVKKIIGGALALAGVFLLVQAVPDIARYIKMRSM
jgi:hypothetical protein